ncbi:MAG: methionine--tRNA ligase [Phycisphaerae bacterium]|nr:methionine--tRNA ligase [Phycisphaerae bacterium]
MSKCYLTTPIYYVNDRPHIGHCYTTTVGDVAARYQRLFGREVFFLTGTDEHAEKVVTAAQEHGLTPAQWADRNAAEFRAAFALLNISNDDFIRTSQARHIERVLRYIAKLQEHGDVYQGDYTGWYDTSQDEYLTETVAKESGFNSPVTGRPLVKRTEKNYFFKLSAYQDRLRKHIADNPDFIMPEARRNEVIGRLDAEEGLRDIPISRASGGGVGGWGIPMPADPGHRIYVWIDALFNYLSVVDTENRREFWPPSAHFLAKDILWFHAVVWPCMLMALGEPLPRSVYAHAYWVRDGRKMSKSLGNFVDLDVIRGYVARYSRDAFRYFLITHGPLGSTDADFAHAKFVEVYNSELANGIGNATSRVANMIAKYFDGRVPDPAGVERHREHDWPSICRAAVEAAIARADSFDLRGAVDQAVGLVRRVDGYINLTEPFKLAKTIEKNPAAKGELAAILYHCAEALRVASLLFAPVIPDAMGTLWKRWGLAAPDPASGDTLARLAAWGGLKPGTAIDKGEAGLFMRADPAEAAPGPA